MSNTNQAETRPVEVSPEAMQALTAKTREWTGWPDAKFINAKPDSHSPWARVDTVDRTIVACIDSLSLNPNRVLLTVTPFRLRQEAVLTGCLLHEASHARHSKWLPATPAEPKALHSDGTTPTRQCIALARTMEEPRVEGLMARDADKIGAAGLAWTMRASAAHLLPFTNLSEHADQAIMDLISSWALRAGRQYALLYHGAVDYLRRWVGNFTALLHQMLVQYITNNSPDAMPEADAKRVTDLLLEMVRCTDDIGPTMLDLSRDVLSILFPETDGEDDAPMPSGGCSVPSPEEGEEDGDAAAESDSEAGDEGEGDESGADGEGDTIPEDEGSGEQPGEGDSGDEQGDEESEPSDEAGEPGDDGSEGDAEQDGEDEGASSSTDDTSALAKALAAMEAEAQGDVEDEAKTEAEETPGPLNASGGRGSNGQFGGGWRDPNPAERDIQRGAERFLRDMVDPTESSKVSLTASPAATVDGAALAAWRAGGGMREPHFFIRRRREVQPSPPVKIGVLVDISSSMEQLQKPSAILSWALASAALDLRNFAGRGQQVESTLIHWGDDAQVIQHNNQPLPGIKEYPCNHGTYAMDEAHALVEEEIPGFFDITETPVNRLLVHFTDWQLFGIGRSLPGIQRALEAGVNILTVVPRNFQMGGSDLRRILDKCPIQRGRVSVLKYNASAPEQVWDEAAAVLYGPGAGIPAPFPGF